MGNSTSSAARQNSSDVSGSRPVKLCFFSSIASFDTGMPICTFKLITLFDKNPGYEVHAIVPEPGELTERLKNKNVRVAVIPFTRLRSAGHFGDFLRFCLGWLSASFTIMGYVKRNKISIIHFSDFIDAPFYPAAFFGGALVIGHLRLCIEKPVRRWFFSLWTGFFARKIICISHAVKKYSGLTDGKTAVILDPGPDYSLFDPSRSYPLHPVLDQKKMRVLTIAKFLWVKGHDCFIRMAVFIEKAMPGAVQFCIVGGRQKGHEKFYDSVLDLARESGILKSIAIIGQIKHEEIPAMLSHTDVFVHLPRYQEGFGGVVCEAMAMGVPVVAFDSGGVGECFRDGKDGFLVEQFNVDAVADKVVSLAKDEILRKTMGKSGMAFVREKFSLSLHAAHVEKVYSAVLGE
jgi:glycosyltransferase involved in cell wall biosynthesis